MGHVYISFTEELEQSSSRKKAFMTHINQRYAVEHLVSLKKFDVSIEGVFNRMYALLSKNPPHHFIPTLIGIEIETPKSNEELTVIRGFLNNLIKVRPKHFVRFVTTTQWAAETNCGYTFYTQDKCKNDYCDVLWKLNFNGGDQIEISMQTVICGPRQELISSLSSDLKRFVKGNKDMTNDDHVLKIIKNFYSRTKKASSIKYLEEDFHILLVPTNNRSGYQPIPLYGMSYFDAKRHYKSVTDQITYDLHNYYEYFTRATDEYDVLNKLVSLIQDNNRLSTDPIFIRENYGLAELLFGFWATYHDAATISNHDIILFHCNSTPVKNIDIYSLGMRDPALLT